MLTKKEVKEVFKYCKDLVRDLDKGDMEEMEELTMEFTEQFINNNDNIEEYLNSVYEDGYNYKDFIIDTLDSNIRYL